MTLFTVLSPAYFNFKEKHMKTFAMYRVTVCGPKYKYRMNVAVPLSENGGMIAKIEELIRDSDSLVKPLIESIGTVRVLI